MAGTVIIGCADQSLAYDLRSQLSEIGDLEVLAVAESTGELVARVVDSEPDLVLVHEQLGPEPMQQVVREISLRRPACVSLVVAGDSDPEVLAQAMDAGARGVLSYPFSFAEVQQRITNALDWSTRLRELLVDRSGDVGGHRALVLALAGAKGGVGVTTVATHLAWDVRRELPDQKVLVVDLDLEKGDVNSVIEARHRTSIADLAKVADDLSLRTVVDAVYEHESGIHLLLPPDDVRDTSAVTPQAIRQIIGLVRQQYDLVVVDVGARVTPVQAAVVEIADEVVVLTTPDLVSIRGLRRNVEWWGRLSVRKPDAVHVVLNRHARADEIQPETVGRLSPSPVLDVTLADQGRRLEQSTNSRSPEYMTDTSWWQSLRGIGSALGVGRRVVTEPDAAPDTPARRQRSRRRKDDEGSASIEFIGVLPWVAIMAVGLLQLVVAGLTFMWTGYAASAAADATAMRTGQVEVLQAARDRVPSAMRDSVRVVSDVGTGRVQVTTDVPLLAPGLFRSPWEMTIDRFVVVEP